MTVEVNNAAWGRVDQVSGSFTFSASRTPDHVYRAVSWQSSGTVVQYTAVPNPGYAFVRWENITARSQTSYETTYPDGSTDSGSSDRVRRAKNTSANPLGYTAQEAAAWNGVMYAPPTLSFFGTYSGKDSASQIGASYSSSSHDENVDQQGETSVHGSSSITWTPQTLRAVFAPEGTTIYSIGTSVDPNDSGETSGDGSYASGSTCTVTATAAEGYAFIGWFENGSSVSSDETYTFTVSFNRTLVAKFGVAVTITAESKAYSWDPLTQRPVRPCGDIQINSRSRAKTDEAKVANGTSCTLTAYPANDSNGVPFVFLRWRRTSPGSPASTSTSNPYTFATTGNETWVAEFGVSVTAVPSPAGAGTVSANPSVVEYGESCILTATPNGRNRFDYWSFNEPFAPEIHENPHTLIYSTVSATWTGYFVDGLTHWLVNSSDKSSPVKLVYDDVTGTGLLVADY